ncbi:MAG: endonuclease/exonuclease/phosphatase family protein [Saprospiraceae bacterium]|nr:endonuclease/exonuclease/phosphatase family protein [Saprospiraceae bacterium]
MKFLTKLSLWINVLIVAMTLMGYLASYVHPATMSIFQTIGLLMPLLLVINLFYLFFWICLRKKFFWLSLVTLILGFQQIQRLAAFHFDNDVPEDRLSICSFNGQNYNRTDRIKDFLSDQVLPEDLGILCLQEISKQHLEGVQQAGGFDHSHYHLGKFILSKYPIINQDHHQFDGTVTGCVWADIATEGGTIRVYNIHLHSNKISSDDLEEFATIPFALSNYSNALQERSRQAQEILKMVSDSPYPTIVVGDFNDSPFSYTYQLFADQLIDQFKASGLGIGATYAGSVPGLKIDYIFADENFEPLHHRILRTKISDHFPLVSYLRLTR